MESMTTSILLMRIIATVLGITYLGGLLWAGPLMSSVEIISVALSAVCILAVAFSSRERIGERPRCVRTVRGICVLGVINEGIRVAYDGIRDTPLTTTEVIDNFVLGPWFFSAAYLMAFIFMACKTLHRPSRKFL